MPTYLGDPIADQFIAEHKHAKRGIETKFALLMLLVKLRVCPLIEVGGKPYPFYRMSPTVAEFKQFYRDRRRNAP